MPTFAGGKFYIVALKNHVNVGFSNTGLSEDENKLFEGTGETMRHIKIRSFKVVNEKKLVELIELVNKKATCTEC
ncbi:MAG: DUF1801 domain-containing protein [Candidatus Bathyarchaeota archaeon]